MYLSGNVSFENFKILLSTTSVYTVRGQAELLLRMHQFQGSPAESMCYCAFLHQDLNALKCMCLGRWKNVLVFFVSLDNTPQNTPPLLFHFHIFIRCYLYKHKLIIK